MSWDWTALLLLDAGLLVVATAVVAVAFLRDLRRKKKGAPEDAR